MHHYSNERDQLMLRVNVRSNVINSNVLARVDQISHLVRITLLLSFSGVRRYSCESDFFCPYLAPGMFACQTEQ